MIRHHGTGEGVHDVSREPDPEEDLATRLIRLLGLAAAHAAHATPFR